MKYQPFKVLSTIKIGSKFTLVYQSGLGDYAPNRKEFENFDQMQNFICTQQRIWFLTAVKKYVSHAAVIITAAHPEQYQALKQVQFIIAEWPHKINAVVYNQFLKTKSWFEKIIPNPNNKSHQGCHHKLNGLVQFAQSKIK